MRTATKISYGILDGNQFEGVDCGATADAIRNALAEAYPEADVTVSVSRGCGCRPSSTKLFVEFDNGDVLSEGDMGDSEFIHIIDGVEPIFA